jgi:hypothetical protein
MVDCNAVRDSVPDLLTETLGGSLREEAHRHIEECENCRAEWARSREAWAALGALHEVAVPVGLRSRFLREADRLAPRAKVVPFPARPYRRWIAQAAAVALLVSGSFYVGQRTGDAGFATPARVDAVAEFPFSLSDRQVFPASAIQPDIQGTPEIRNVRFVQPGSDSNEVAVSFDMTSNVTVTGKPDDKSLVNLLSYVIQSEDNPTMSKSDAMEWVRQTYAARGNADPTLVRALAHVLKNEPHEGVRIKAVETLRQIPPGSAPEARIALIEALQNDPNPAVRLKAIEALANIARTSGKLDRETLDMLRQKAAQDDENPYVRVKAAEALSQIHL